MKQKKYLKCFAKEYTFASGGSIINLSINKEDFDSMPNKKGYVKLIVAKKTTVDKFNNTHYVYLDEFEPKSDENKSNNEMPF